MGKTSAESKTILACVKISRAGHAPSLPSRLERPSWGRPATGTSSRALPPREPAASVGRSKRNPFEKRSYVPFRGQEDHKKKRSIEDIPEIQQVKKKADCKPCSQLLLRETGNFPNCSTPTSPAHVTVMGVWRKSEVTRKLRVTRLDAGMHLNSPPSRHRHRGPGGRGETLEGDEEGDPVAPRARVAEAGAFLNHRREHQIHLRADTSAPPL